MTRCDLHCHSTHSDGMLSPEELVEKAKKLGLSALAITDHDSISAYSVAKKHGGDLKLLTGVELSTRLDRCEIHILGYAFLPDHPALLQLTDLCRERRVARNNEILAKLREAGCAIEEQDVMEAGVIQKAWGRVHIAHTLMKKGYVASIQEAFHRYIGEKKPCYVPGQKFSVPEAIDAIHEAGGKAVIAHPHLIQSSTIVNQLLDMPFDGIEVHYSLFKPAVNLKWQKIADEKGWLATGGSDFHGELVRPDVELGCQVCPDAVFKTLWDHFQQELGR